MAFRTVIRYLVGPVPAFVLSVVLLAGLLMLTAAAQHSAAFSAIYSQLLLWNVLGITLLLCLIVISVVRLLRQLGKGVLGSRLTLRLFATFSILALIPLGVVYYFSVQFLNRGIDSWFDVRIEQALQDALLLGRTSLEALKQDAVVQTERGALRIGDSTSQLETIRLLDEIREQGGFQEMSLFTHTGRIVASSSRDAMSLVPDTPAEGILAQARGGQVHVGIEPVPEAGLQMRVVVPVSPRGVSEPGLVLQGIQPLPLRYANLAESIQDASAEYEQLVYLRGPLKFSFVLTLTLVTLMTMLLAVWAAIFSSRRLAAPLRDLAEGTRAVASGDYGKRVPVTSGDELGVLVQSFNDMTRRIHEAQSQARRSQREAEEQGTYLEAVLGHLSTGVLSFERDGRLRTDNAAAAAILEVDLAAARGRQFHRLAIDHPRLAPLVEFVRNAMQRQVTDTHAQIVLSGHRGRQTLMCRGTRLPGSGRRVEGYVVVFDDVTDLIQAQREAAWGEVARRLAHEIKNPLTPIQLSAERLRRKYLLKLPADDRDALDRATRTIVQQVGSMKTMVDAFASYAQPARMQLSSVNLNDLLRDVVELHASDERPLAIELELDEHLPMLSVDTDRLRQVLNNLIINARDATAGGAEPRLNITTRTVQWPGSDGVEVRFRDNGGGFDEAMLDRIFEPYVTTKEKGTGLGLAIVKRIVEEHGGTVRAENAEEGGAMVVIQMPCTGESAAAERSAPVPRSNRAAS